MRTVKTLNLKSFLCVRNQHDAATYSKELILWPHSNKPERILRRVLESLSINMSKSVGANNEFWNNPSPIGIFLDIHPPILIVVSAQLSKHFKRTRNLP